MMDIKDLLVVSVGLCLLLIAIALGLYWTLKDSGSSIADIGNVPEKLMRKAGAKTLRVGILIRADGRGYKSDINIREGALGNRSTVDKLTDEIRKHPRLRKWAMSIYRLEEYDTPLTSNAQEQFLISVRKAFTRIYGQSFKVDTTQSYTHFITVEGPPNV